MAVKTSWSAGDVLAAADLTDTFAAKASTAEIISKTTIDAKGDLIAGTANDTIARLPVGTDGQILTALASQATGLQWQSFGAWTTFTPSFSNITTGNGTISDNRYCQIGKFVIFTCAFTLGSTSSVGSDPAVAYPIGQTALTGNPVVGDVSMTDASAGTIVIGKGIQVGGNVRAVRQFNSGGGEIVAAGISATAPFIWTTSDRIYWQIAYEAA